MSRARNIKPGFFRNADLVELPVETRLLFVGLWTLADREGRLEDRPRQIKMEIFPADSFDVGLMLSQLHSAGFINRYEVGTLKFIEVENFIKHQDPHYKEKASEIPPPPGKENFMKATGVTRTQRQRILDRDGHKCQSCGATESLCMDHILPISRGGDSSDDNLQVLCSACNTKKGNKIDGEEKNSRQRRVNINPRLTQGNDASPSEPGFLNPDSRSLIADSLIPDPQTHTAATGESAGGQKPVCVSPDETGFDALGDILPMGKVQDTAVIDRVAPTMAAAVCVAMRAERISDCNPSHPDINALLAQGAEIGLFASAAREAVKKGKGFAYALAIVKGQIAGAQKIAAASISKQTSKGAGHAKNAEEPI